MNDKPNPAQGTPERAGSEFEYTERGFAIYGRLRDRVGTDVRVQESSLATERAVWVFSTTMAGEDGALHLEIEQATALRDALSSAIEDAEAGR